MLDGALAITHVTLAAEQADIILATCFMILYSGQSQEFMLDTLETALTTMPETKERRYDRIRHGKYVLFEFRPLASARHGYSQVVFCTARPHALVTCALER